MQANTPQGMDGAPNTVRAVNGERMWIRLNHDKADKRELFEQFIHDILRPAVERVEPAMFRQVRFLHPTEPNEDGTYTYVFLMDPLIEGADYGIENLLKRAYGDTQVEAYDQMWDAAVASPQTGYELIQSPW
ncbi:MAG: hypothetical protein M3R04_09605 [bacterium]|nr:hypothetical protein [bacterium]